MNKTKKENVNVQFKKNDIIEFGTYPQTKDGDTFKVEPIKWRVLDINNGEALLLSEKILDAHMFAEESNNYADSEIRRWLNNEFYNKAFNKEEKSRIVTTNVDNSVRSTYPNGLTEEELKEYWDSGKNKYVCENTSDKVFLLSEQEVTNEEYGFNADTTFEDLNRQKQATEYAISQDLLGYSENDNSCWWLRSPYCAESESALNIDLYGYANFSEDVTTIDEGGVVPALRIKLN